MSIQLSDRASVIIGCIPNDLQAYSDSKFMELFYTHPEERAKICFGESEVPVHRWQKSYGEVPERKNRSGFYMFRGADERIEKELPAVLQPFMDWANSQGAGYNQVTVCWYETPEDYIAFHSDYSKNMDHESGVLMINLCKDKIGLRKFRILAKGRAENCLISDLKIPLRPGTTVTLKGEDAHRYFRHGVSPVDNCTPGPRISLSFRKYTHE